MFSFIPSLSEVILAPTGPPINIDAKNAIASIISYPSHLADLAIGTP